MTRDFILLSAGRLVQSLIGVLSIRLLTSILPPEEVGNYYLIFSVIGFCTLTLISPVGFYMNRKLHGWVEHGVAARRYRMTHGYLLAVSGISFAAVYFACKYLGIGSSLHPLHFAVIVGVFLYFSTCNQAIIPAFNMLGQRMPFVLFTILTLTFGLAASVGLAWFGARGAVSWILGQGLALGVFALISWRYFRRLISPAADPVKRGAPEPETLAGIFSFTWPLALTYFFMWGQNLSYRIIIEKTAGLEFLGLLGVGFGIAAGLAAALESVVQQLYFPRFYGGINTADPQKRAVAWNSMAKATLPLYASFAIMVSCLSPFLMTILAGKEFHSSFLFLLCGAWVELFRMSNNVLAGVAHSEMQTRHLIKSYLAGAVVASAGTFYAAAQPDRAALVPSILIASGMATVLVMYFDMRKLMRLGIFNKELLLSLALSLPFPAALLFYPLREDFLPSAGVVLIFGLYFCYSQYRLNSRIVESPKVPDAPPGAPAPGGLGGLDGTRT